MLTFTSFQAAASAECKHGSRLILEYELHGGRRSGTKI